MDFTWIAQTATMLMVGALGYFLKRTMDKIEANISTLSQKLEKTDEKYAQEVAELKRDLSNFKADLPLIYTLREDFTRVMNGVDSKLDKIYYSKGVNHSERV